MNKINKGKNIFSNALKDIQRNNTESNTNLKYKVKGMYSEIDDVIDFDRESDRLGESVDPSSRMRSAVIPVMTKPYPVSSHRNIPLSNIRHSNVNKKIKIIKKTGGNGKIVLISTNKHDNNNIKVKTNLDDNWKHDLYTEASNFKHIAFIRNLPRIMTEKLLRQIYSEYGNITGVNIERDTAEIHFTRKDQAVKATDMTNGREYFGKVIKVSYYEEKNEELQNNRTSALLNTTENKKEDYNNNIQINRSRKNSIWDRIKLNKNEYN